MNKMYDYHPAERKALLEAGEERLRTLRKMETEYEQRLASIREQMKEVINHYELNK